MVKKIGKIFFLITVFFANVFARTDVLTLNVTDMNGHSVQELMRGVSYLLEIKADGNQDLHKLVIPGLNALHHEFRGASRLTMMSKVTTQHTYVIRADTIGTYVIGPAHMIGERRTTRKSNVLSFSVVQEQQQDVIVQLSTSVDRAVIGEKIVVRVRLNTRVPTELMSIEQPKLDPSMGSLSELKQIDRGTVTIDNVMYEYAEWHAELTLNKVGTLIIPPFRAQCKLLNKQERSQDFFSAMLHRLGAGSPPQNYFSNDLSLVIDPLPYHAGILDAIGVFSHFSATLNQQKAHVGEGMVLTLMLEGKTNLDEIKAPHLVIQDGLKYYESKMINHQNGVAHYKKSFEYIVQGMKPGSYEIPEQVFTFFNTETKVFEMLKTKPLPIIITPNQLIKNEQIIKPDGPVVIDFDEDDIFPLQVTGSWLLKKERSLSWFWFLLATLLPLLYCCYYFAGMYISEYRNIHKQYLTKKYAFKHAKKQLKNNNKTTMISFSLYDIFMNLFADRLQLSLSDLTAEVIEAKLNHVGFSHDVIEQWRRFFHKLEEAAFMPKNKTKIDAELVKRAEIWLKQLEEKL